jgi:hypothetical protein
MLVVTARGVLVIAALASSNSLVSLGRASASGWKVGTEKTSHNTQKNPPYLFGAEFATESIPEVLQWFIL